MHRKNVDKTIDKNHQSRDRLNEGKVWLGKDIELEKSPVEEIGHLNDGVLPEIFAQ